MGAEMVRGPLCRVGVAVGRDDEGGGPLDMSGFGMIRRLLLPRPRAFVSWKAKPARDERHETVDGREINSKLPCFRTRSDPRHCGQMGRAGCQTGRKCVACVW